MSVETHGASKVEQLLMAAIEEAGQCAYENFTNGQMTSEKLCEAHALLHRITLLAERFLRLLN